MNFKEFKNLVKSDFSCYMSSSESIKNKIGTILLNPSFQLGFLYRIARFCHLKKIKIIPSIIEWFQIVLYSSKITREADIGKQFVLAHPIGVVIGRIKAGRELTVWQNVTMGSHGNKDKVPAYPILGDNVKVFANSMIIGGITIGSNSVVGAMTLVTKDIPERCIAAGIPAKIIKKGVI